MTRAEALQEAQRRWGERARAVATVCNHLTSRRGRPLGCDGGHGRTCPGGNPLFRVGYSLAGGAGLSVQGYGDSWEAAFQRSDRLDARLRGEVAP